MIDLVVGTAGLYLAYGLFFSGVERIWPVRRGQARVRAGFWVDVAWVLTFAVLGGAFDWVDSELLDLLLAHGDHVLDPIRATVASLPASAQVIAAVVIADFSGYWKHRLHHTRWLWPVHAIHHSSTEVDWLSSERAHPVEGLLTALFQILPLAALGFPPLAIAAAGVIRRTHSIYEHANLRVRYPGTLARILVSPSLHRWHHATERGVRDTNFANIFALYDWIFGTLRLPDAPEPEHLGLPEIPSDYLGQWVAPLVRSPARSASG